MVNCHSTILWRFKPMKKNLYLDRKLSRDEEPKIFSKILFSAFRGEPRLEPATLSTRRETTKLLNQFMKTVFSFFLCSLQRNFIFWVYFCTDEINRSESQLTCDWRNGDDDGDDDDGDNDDDDRLGFRWNRFSRETVVAVLQTVNSLSGPVHPWVEKFEGDL